MNTLDSLATDLYFPRKIALRSEKTKCQYHFAIADFSKHLGHAATAADLDDDLLTVWMSAMLARGLAIHTVRERAGRIIALWNWLAKRRVVDRFPAVEKPQAPEPQPQSMSELQIQSLFQSAARERGHICGVPASLWWVSLLAFVWSTAERKSAALSVRCEWVDLDRAVCQIPAKYRKGGRKPATYLLWPEVVTLLRRSLDSTPPRELFWPFDHTEVCFYLRLKRICADAGWPLDRKHKMHCLRVSHATWLKVLGGDATRALMHSSAATTDRHYIDTARLPPDPRRLFIPWAG